MKGFAPGIIGACLAIFVGCSRGEPASPAPAAARAQNGPSVAAGSATAPSIAATPAPSIDCLIANDAIGPLRLGMRLGEAQRAMPKATFLRTSDGEGVALVEVTMDGESLAIVYAGEDDSEKPVDMSRPIEHLETFHAGCATAEGVHPGSPVDAVEAAYGPTRVISLSEIESREYIDFERQPRGLQFRLDYSGEFSEGKAETTRYAKGAKLLSVAVITTGRPE